MSSNNFIKIHRSKHGFEVTHRDADTGSKIENIGRYKELEDAVKAANKFIDENEVEYGLRVHV
jgi:hypothetical protein